jgi:hypothetical protein
MDDKANNSRRGGAKLGGLMVLLVALASAGYALSSSPSASTGTDGKPAGNSSSQVLAPAASTNGNNGNGSSSSSSDNCVEPSNGNGNCVKAFGVTVGSTPLLYPSLTRQLPVTFSNPNNFDINVTSYKVSVGVPAAKAADCPASSLQVPPGTVMLAPQLTATKNSSVTTYVSIKLPANAPEGCQDVPFSITVNASAVKK